MNDIKKEDERIKKEAVEYDSNTLILARAGSGKTTFLIDKLFFILNNNKISNIKKVALVTFTNDAVDNLNKKILEKYKEDNSNKYIIRTIDSFIMSEIVQPFFYSYKGYRINQFNFKRDFKKSTNDKLSLINLMEHQNIIASYVNKGKNFLCELALDILKENTIAREYLSYTYEWIFIDEAQDCDEDMFKLFKYLSNELNIKLCIVGDDKQSIYKWRGARTDLILSLKDENDFKLFHFKYNYRSNESIYTLSNLISEDIKFDNIKELNKVYEQNIYYYKNNNFQNIEIIKNLVNKGKIDICGNDIFFIFRRNIDIESTIKCLKVEFPDNTFIIRKNINVPLFEEISRYYFLCEYSYEEFLLKTGVNKDETSNKVIHSCLDKIKENIETNNAEQYLEELYTELNKKTLPEYTPDDLKSFVNFLRDDSNKAIFQNANYNSLLTIHNSKGLENNTVVLFLDKSFYRQDDWKELLYVAITRAKVKLIIIDDTNITNITNIEQKLKLLEDCKLITSIPKI